MAARLSPLRRLPVSETEQQRGESELTLEDIDPYYSTQELTSESANAPLEDLSFKKRRSRVTVAETAAPQPPPNESPFDDLTDIYDTVDAVVPRHDDPTLPVLTFRVILLGGFFCVALACANTLFTFRTNYFYANPFIGVLISYPLAKFMEKVLPKGILNPGPFNHKEHALIYVACNSGANTAYALYNIVGQKYQLYQENLTDVWAVLFAINTQIFGYGLAGLCRRYLVRPPSMLWPSNLSVVAMLNSLHESQTLSASSSNPGSRFRFFWIVTGIAALWQIVPGYIAPIFTAVSVLCWVAPYTPRPDLVRLMGSAQQGYGMGSLSFDWNTISVLSPLTTPLWALINQVLGLWLFVWIITPLLWYNNVFGKDYDLGSLPSQGPNGTGRFYLSRAINTPALFDKTGRAIPARSFVTLPSLTLNETLYESARPIYITTYFAMDYFCSFTVFTAALVHVALWHGRDIVRRFRSALRDLDSNDIHARLMDVYPEVPDWWYWGLLGLNTVGAGVVCHFGGFDLPWWGVLLGLALAMVSVLPIGIIQAVSGQAIGLNVMSEFMIGLILPGRMAAVMAFKTLSYMSMYQGLLLVSDLKLGHYMKIPPRHMFGVQLATTIASSILNVFVAKTIYESFGRTCVDKEDGSRICDLWKLQENPPLGWSATNYNVFLNAGAIWGAIAPARFFGPGSPYQWTLLGFGIGLVLPVIPWSLHKAFPKSGWHYVNIPLIVIFPGLGAGSTRSELITPLLVGIIVNYFIKKHRHGWWKKYAYVMSAALDSGLAITLTLLFLGFQSGIGARTESETNRLFPFWALNRVDGENCAEDWYLRCSENAAWGKAWGKTGYYQIKEIDPFCTSINFQNGNARARQAAFESGIVTNATDYY
ncbi:hypothetical protein HDU67_006449 [Dinochytrium kinnereticum]|nr:hypothetical protein HDU67_006449 [Dinochytrium kinnereticum]